MRTFKDIYHSKEELEEGLPQKKSPMQRRREMSRRMKILAKKSSVKMAKKRARFKRRSTEKLQKSAARQAKMMVIKRSLGPSVNYGELSSLKYWNRAISTHEINSILSHGPNLNTVESRSYADELPRYLDMTWFNN